MYTSYEEGAQLDNYICELTTICYCVLIFFPRKGQDAGRGAGTGAGAGSAVGAGMNAAKDIGCLDKFFNQPTGT